VCNLDGSNPRQIPVTLPAGLIPFLAGRARLTSDGTSIVFAVSSTYVLSNNSYYPATTSGTGLYTCGIDGSGLKLIVGQGTGTTGTFGLLDAN
jgi:hypothetical protein